MSKIVIGDVHGCYLTLMELIKQFPSGIEYIFAGDLVDRGPRNRQVIDFVRNNYLKCTKGNHELLMQGTKFGQQQDWLYCGGAATYKEYKDDLESLAIDREWVKNLPIYYEFEDEINADGRYLVVSHTTIAEFWNHRTDDRFHEQMVWDRRNFPKSIPGVYNIYGHTPVSKPVIKEHFANIDTGCVFNGHHNLGHLTALQFPEMIVYQQKCCDYGEGEDYEV